VKDGKYKGAHWETRREILNKLKMRGALSSNVMAEELGISSMAVRQHLRELRDFGDVTSEDLSKGKGRPTKYWELTEKANRHFSDRHRDLILDLLSGLSETVGQEGMDGLLRRRGAAQIDFYAKKVDRSASLFRQTKALAKMRSEEGYMADVERGEAGVCYLVENHCPICAAAESCAGLCAAELSVFQQVFGNEVSVERTEHLMTNSRRCVYRITPKQDQRIA
jgi:predicted ArsR family transcriptional regulator|tara:strand:+ start:6443 stop:7111 length:669 start_codon:yes stop_codon:yes gene_type:complete